MAEASSAGWTVLRPRTYAQPALAPEAPTPQYHHLAAAYLEHEGQRLAKMLAAGADRGELQPWLDRWRQRVVAGVVPWHCNEYVAYWPEAPSCTAVFIPHRPGARRGFWTAQPQQPAPGSGAARSRLETYRRLADYLPVFAVVSTAALGHHYAPLLTAAGLRWTTPLEVSTVLAAVREAAGVK